MLPSSIYITAAEPKPLDESQTVFQYLTAKTGAVFTAWLHSVLIEI